MFDKFWKLCYYIPANVFLQKRSRVSSQSIFAVIHLPYIMKGTIKRLVAEKNFGFIGPEDGSNDVFFHATALQGVEFGQLQVGDAVSFDVEQSEKGPRAVNVVRA